MPARMYFATHSCDTCDMDSLNESRTSTYSDVVESLNDPLNISGTSSTIIGEAFSFQTTLFSNTAVMYNML